MRGPKSPTDITSIVPPDAKGGDNHHPCTSVEDTEDAEIGTPTQSQEYLCDRIEPNNSQGMKRRSEDLDSHAVRDISNGTVTGRGRKRFKVSVASHVLDLEEF